MSDTSDKGKKVMPLITTYQSDDDSWDGEFSSSQEPESNNNRTDEEDDNRPLSQLRLASKQVANCPEPAKAHPQLSDYDGSCSSSSSSSGSDTEVDGLADTAFDQLIAQFASVPVSELIASREFTTLRKRMNRDRPGQKRPLSAYALFFKDLLPELKSAHPNARFGEIARLVAEEWDALSPQRRKEYKRRGAAIRREHVQSILTYKTRLLNLNSNHAGSRQCSNPSCSNPVRTDPRWNGQYCSAECVRDHCRLTFTNWCVGKRLGKTANSGATTTTASTINTTTSTTTKSEPVSADANEQTRPMSRTVAKEDERSSLDRLRQLVSDADIKPAVQPPASESTPVVTTVENKPVALKLEDPYMPSALTNRKPLFESLRISTMPFSLLTKPESASPTTPDAVKVARSPPSPSARTTS